MASYLYDKGRQKFLEGSISWSSDDIKVSLIDNATYTPSQSADEFYSTIPVGERVAASSNLASKTTTAGVADAADVVLSTVSGDICELIVGWKDTTDVATSPLIFKIDDYAGLPVTPNGGNITIAWPSDSNKIFKL